MQTIPTTNLSLPKGANIKDSFISTDGDLFTLIVFSSTLAAIFKNDKIAYSQITPEEGIFYMGRLPYFYGTKKDLPAIGRRKICICKCHASVEEDFDKVQHCGFCLSGRFIKKLDSLKGGE